MTEQELKNIGTRLNLELFDIGMRAGEDEEPDIPETLQDINALIVEVRRLQVESDTRRLIIEGHEARLSRLQREIEGYSHLVSEIAEVLSSDATNAEIVLKIDALFIRSEEQDAT